MNVGFNIAGKAGVKLGNTRIGQIAGRAFSNGAQAIGTGIDHLLPQGVKRVINEAGEKLNNKFVQASLKNCLTISDDGIYSVKINGYSVQLIKDELSEEILEAISKGDNTLVFNYANEVLAYELSKNATDATTAGVSEAFDTTSEMQTEPTAKSSTPSRNYVVDVESGTMRPQEDIRRTTCDETITEVNHPVRGDNTGVELKAPDNEFNTSKITTIEQAKTHLAKIEIQDKQGIKHQRFNADEIEQLAELYLEGYGAEIEFLLTIHSYDENSWKYLQSEDILAFLKHPDFNLNIFNETLELLTQSTSLNGKCRFNQEELNNIAFFKECTDVDFETIAYYCNIKNANGEYKFSADNIIDILFYQFNYSNINLENLIKTFDSLTMENLEDLFNFAEKYGIEPEMLSEELACAYIVHPETVIEMKNLGIDETSITTDTIKFFSENKKEIKRLLDSEQISSSQIRELSNIYKEYPVDLKSALTFSHGNKYALDKNSLSAFLSAYKKYKEEFAYLLTLKNNAGDHVIHNFDCMFSLAGALKQNPDVKKFLEELTNLKDLDIFPLKITYKSFKGSKEYSISADRSVCSILMTTERCVQDNAPTVVMRYGNSTQTISMLEDGTITKSKADDGYRIDRITNLTVEEFFEITKGQDIIEYSEFIKLWTKKAKADGIENFTPKIKAKQGKYINTPQEWYYVEHL